MLSNKKRVVMELVDMNSLGLFDIYILSVQVGFTLKKNEITLY